MRVARAVACLYAGGLLAVGAQAQVLYTLQSPEPQVFADFGWSVSGAGDVNNDGYPDVVIGAYEEHVGEWGAHGKAYVFNGATGAPLYTLRSPFPESDGHFGRSVSCAGDVNNDGHADVVVGASEEFGGVDAAGTAYVFNGRTGRLLYALQSPVPEVQGSFGFSVSGAGDVNNDGCPDVLVGAWREKGGATEAGKAHVFSGQTGATLYMLQSPNPEFQGSFGFSVAGAGDVNSDGYADVVVGARNEDAGAADAGRAYVFSGPAGAPLRTLLSPSPEYGGLFGCCVAGVGDVNNDGYSDVVVGAEQEDGGAEGGGRAFVFSGATGAVLYTLQSPNPTVQGRFGCSVSGAGDVDNDGYADVIIGARCEDGGATETGRAYVFSGATGDVFFTLESANPELQGHFGCSVSGASDVNGDNRGDVVVGAHRESGGATSAGRAYVFDGVQVPVELASLVAALADGGVRLEWVTMSESGNLGFRVYRAATFEYPSTGSGQGEYDYDRITDELIPGAGSSAIAHCYSYVDGAVESGRSYYYKLADVCFDGAETLHGPVSVTVPTSMPAEIDLAAGRWDGSHMRLKLVVPSEGEVRLSVYDLAGRQVATLVDRVLPAVRVDVLWDGTDNRGVPLASSAYVFRLAHDSGAVSERVVLIR
jgi:hypothetical protein